MSEHEDEEVLRLSCSGILRPRRLREREALGTRIDENSRAKEGGRNLVPRVVSYLSPSRSKGRVGRNSGNEVGREGENGRDFAPLFSHVSLRFVTSHSCVSCPRKTRPLRRGRERSLPSLFCPHSHFFFVFRKILLDHWFFITEQWM